MRSCEIGLKGVGIVEYVLFVEVLDEAGLGF